MTPMTHVYDQTTRAASSSNSIRASHWPPCGNSPQQHQPLGLQESQPIPQQVAAALSA